jgi:hypothetical protein
MDYLSGPAEKNSCNVGSEYPTKRLKVTIMPSMPEEELMEKEAALEAEVERLLPDFVNSCRDKIGGTK